MRVSYGFFEFNSLLYMTGVLAPPVIILFFIVYVLLNPVYFSGLSIPEYV